jgi:adenylate kinase
MPAAGKSTIASAIASAYPQVEHIRFGQLVFEAVAEDYPSISYDRMRSMPATYVERRHIASAEGKLLERLSASAAAITLIDSHAAALDPSGVRVTPHTVDFVRSLRLSAILLLDAADQVITARISANPSGRRIPTTLELMLLRSTQASIATTYAFAAGCELRVADTSACAVGEVPLALVELLGLGSAM